MRTDGLFWGNRRVGLLAVLLPVVGLTGCSTPIVVPPVYEGRSGESLPGKFVWHDLVTTDPDAAEAFYGPLLGWEFSPVGEGNYRVIRSRRRAIGGIVDSGKAGMDSAQAFWLCGISCEDVDAAAAAVKDAGGKVLRGPADLPERGRIAIVEDAQGALVQLIDSGGRDAPDEKPGINRWLWQELVTDAPDRAAAFYTEVLPYQVETIEVSDEKTYRMLRSGDVPRAGVVPNPFTETAPIWIPFIRVEDPAAMATKAESLGGTVAVAPRDDLRNKSVAIVLDPTGAPIALQKWDGPAKEGN